MTYTQLAKTLNLVTLFAPHYHMPSSEEFDTGGPLNLEHVPSIPCTNSSKNHQYHHTLQNENIHRSKYTDKAYIY